MVLNIIAKISRREIMERGLHGEKNKTDFYFKDHFNRNEELNTKISLDLNLFLSIPSYKFTIYFVSEILLFLVCVSLKSK